MKRKILASVCALIFSAMLTGCGTETGQDISSDFSSMMPSTDNSSQQNNNNNSSNTDNDNSMQYSSDDSSNQGSDNTSEVKISKEKAKEIALKHANVKESEITDYEIDLDYENGKKVYEISFDHKNHEYDYDIDANTGDITHSDKEVKD